MLGKNLYCESGEALEQADHSDSILDFIIMNHIIEMDLRLQHWKQRGAQAPLVPTYYNL